MKKKLLFILMLAGIYANAQLNPRERLLAGTLQLNFYTSKLDTGAATYNKGTVLNSLLSPQFQWVKNKHTIYGISVSAGMMNQKFETNTGNIHHRGYSAGAGAYIQKIAPIQNKFSFIYNLGQSYCTV